MLTSTILFIASSALAAATPVRRTTPDTLGPIDNVLPPVVPVNTRANDQTIIAQLKQLPTQEDRSALLNQPGDYVFDFADLDPPEHAASEKGLGGISVAANARTMPALIGLDSSMTVAFLGPCGMNSAHVHPRGTELNIVVKGRLATNFVVENGVKPIANLMETFQMSVFPQGSIHQEFNPDCDEAVFVASFNNQDPGVSQIAQNFFALDDDVIQATLGGGPVTFDGADLDTFRDKIPANIALGIEACLNKCGIERKAKRDISEILPKRK
jgi:hypothetical protein